MESLIDWAAQYSAPILVLLCIAAATIFVLKMVTERTIEAKFSQMQKTIELSLERRSEFEQRFCSTATSSSLTSWLVWNVFRLTSTERGGVNTSRVSTSN